MPFSSPYEPLYYLEIWQERSGIILGHLKHTNMSRIRRSHCRSETGRRQILAQPPSRIQSLALHRGLTFFKRAVASVDRTRDQWLSFALHICAMRARKTSRPRFQSDPRWSASQYHTCHAVSVGGVGAWIGMSLNVARLHLGRPLCRPSHGYAGLQYRRRHACTFASPNPQVEITQRGRLCLAIGTPSQNVGGLYVSA